MIIPTNNFTPISIRKHWHCLMLSDCKWHLLLSHIPRLPWAALLHLHPLQQPLWVMGYRLHLMHTSWAYQNPPLLNNYTHTTRYIDHGWSGWYQQHICPICTYIASTAQQIQASHTISQEYPGCHWQGGWSAELRTYKRWAIFCIWGMLASFTGQRNSRRGSCQTTDSAKSVYQNCKSLISWFLTIFAS